MVTCCHNAPCVIVFTFGCERGVWVTRKEPERLGHSHRTIQPTRKCKCFDRWCDFCDRFSLIYVQSPHHASIVKTAKYQALFGGDNDTQFVEVAVHGGIEMTEDMSKVCSKDRSRKEGLCTVHNQSFGFGPESQHDTSTPIPTSRPRSATAGENSLLPTLDEIEG